jgi:DivIVA domain-containing protein
MNWFFAILVVALMGGAAVVAIGSGGSMAEAYDDRPDSWVPADAPLGPADLRAVRFSTAFRGYRMSEVDALLDRLAAELEPVDGLAPVSGPEVGHAPDPVVGPAEAPGPVRDGVGDPDGPPADGPPADGPPADGPVADGSARPQQDA